MNQRKSPLILAFDIGSSSLRTALFDTSGERLVATTAQKAYRLKNTADGGAELAPAVLLKAAREALRETLRHSPGAPILGVGMSCFWHSLVGLDRQHKPMTPIFTWADSRCRPDAAHLREELGERAVHARTGCMLRASFWPAKLVWLHRTQRKVFAKVSHWVSPAEWLCYEFCGAATCGFSMASGTGIFNAHELRWDRALLERCRVSESSLQPISENPVGDARDFSRLKNVPWFPAIGDGAASNLGSGAMRSGLVAINVGTSAAVRVVRADGPPRAPFGLSCYRVDDQRFLIGGAVSNAGNLRAWCMRELRLDENAIEKALAQRSAPNHGLTVLPFWSAERAPTWQEDRYGMIDGIGHNTTALDMLQAIVEASYFRLARITKLFLAEEKTTPKFIVSGGIQRSRSSLQRLANVLNQPLYTNDEREASLRGAAIYVLQKLGFTLLPLRLAKPIRPQPKLVPLYARAFEQQLRAELG
jgi:gluconokinase